MRYDDDPSDLTDSEPGRPSDDDTDDETGRADEGSADEKSRERPTLELIAEHLELADKLRKSGSGEDVDMADMLTAIAEEMADELATSLPEHQLQRLCREPEPPPPIVIGPPVDDHLPTVPVVLFQSPWLRSSGSSGVTIAPMFADRASFGPSEPTLRHADRLRLDPPDPRDPLDRERRENYDRRDERREHRETSAVPPDVHVSRRFLPTRPPVR